MELAMIVPTILLNEICGGSAMQMCLAHNIIRNGRHAEFYRSAVRDNCNVILDNSLWELGNSMRDDLLIAACEALQYPSELIIPDVFRDGPATIESVEGFLERSHARIGYDWGKNLCVVHGKDRREWIETYDYFSKQDYAHVLALPKVLDDIWHPGGRIGCVAFLEATGRVNLDKEYHCLGVWDDPIEILLLSSHKWIRSLDTALPVHSGLQGIKFDPVFGLARRRPKRPHGYFELSELEIAEHLETIRYNTHAAQQWAAGCHDWE